MAGVGQIEYIFLLLRVEHQCVLVGALHRLQQLGDKPLHALLASGSANGEFFVVLLQFRLEDCECLFQIFLLKYSASFHEEAKQQK